VEKAYCQDFNHYHIGEITGHMEEMAIGPDKCDYGPSKDDNQGTAWSNCVEGQRSDKSDASQWCDGYSSTEEGGRSERSNESYKRSIEAYGKLDVFSSDDNTNR